jgi:hypothetical protein
VPVHVGSDWAVAGLPWMLSLHHLPLMSLLPLQPQLPVAALQLLAPCLAAAASRSCGQWSRPKEMAPTDLFRLPVANAHVQVQAQPGSRVITIQPGGRIIPRMPRVNALMRSSCGLWLSARRGPAALLPLSERLSMQLTNYLQVQVPPHSEEATQAMWVRQEPFCYFDRSEFKQTPSGAIAGALRSQAGRGGGSPSCVPAPYTLSGPHSGGGAGFSLCVSIITEGAVEILPATASCRRSSLLLLLRPSPLQLL